ncbi:SDR family oxidoreductase [Aminobacter sp. Piv2-1]|uniref:SDR family oxidoreductase n=1 Tax=Aminobacter sp. Piv2-1 TaxID=3031122 RepID=UPI0030B57FCD
MEKVRRSLLVTGAAQGIGASIANLAQETGWHVLATDRSEQMSGGAPTLSYDTAKLDVGAQSDIDAIVGTREFDAVVNCAAIVPVGKLLDCSASELLACIDINVGGIHRVLHAALPSMRRKKSGVIVNIASICSTIRSFDDRYAYSASKGAVIAMSRAIALDYAADGIRCNVVCPGTIKTESLRARVDQAGDPTAMLAQMTARQRLGRLGAPDEVARLCLYLLSDAASFCTGGVFTIDGGASL